MFAFLFAENFLFSIFSSRKGDLSVLNKCERCEKGQNREKRYKYENLFNREPIKIQSLYWIWEEISFYFFIFLCVLYCDCLIFQDFLFRRYNAFKEDQIKVLNEVDKWGWYYRCYDCISLIYDNGIFWFQFVLRVGFFSSFTICNRSSESNKEYRMIELTLGIKHKMEVPMLESSRPRHKIIGRIIEK